MLVYFDIAAALILIAILITAFMRRLTSGTTNRMMLGAIGMALITTVFDIISVVTNGMPDMRETQYAANALYLFFHVLSSAFYLFYLISVADTWHKLRKNMVNYLIIIVPFVVFTFLLFTSRYTELVFYIDAEGFYKRGSLFFINYLISGIYLMLSMIHLFKYKHMLSARMIVIMIMPYPMLLVSMLIQFYMPQYLVEMLVDAIALMLVWSNIQRPEELLDPTTGLGNRTTYHSAVKRAFALDKPLYVIRIEAKKISEIQEAYGAEAANPLMRMVADKLRRCDKAAKSHATICHNRERVYFMLVGEKHFNTVGNLGSLLVKELNFRYEFGQNKYDIHSYLCLYRIPQDIGSYSAIGNLGNLFANDTGLKCDVMYTAERLFREKKYRLRVDINQIIDKAIKNESFEMYYQPIYSFEKHSFVAAEALLRLNDDQFGYIRPDYVITAAEEVGMMYLIDEIVLKKTIKMLADRKPEQYGLKFLNINLSMHQCKQDNLADIIISTARKYGVRPEMLNLEITETAAANTSESSMANYRKLHAEGVKLSVDDFGKGYSNLRQIVSFPLNIVKLDQTLSAVNDDGGLATLVSNIIPMLVQMNFETLIEGVETAEQAMTFESLGCQYCQGYYYAKPMPEDEFIEFMKKNMRYEDD